MIMYCFHNNNPVHFTIIKDLQMIDLQFAFRSMIDRSGFDRSDRSFSRIVWPLFDIPIFPSWARTTKLWCVLFQIDNITASDHMPATSKTTDISQSHSVLWKYPRPFLTFPLVVSMCYVWNFNLLRPGKKWTPFCWPHLQILYVDMFLFDTNSDLNPKVIPRGRFCWRQINVSDMILSQACLVFPRHGY